MVLYFIWDVSPELFSSGSFQFTWLTFFLVAGVLVGRAILFFLLKKESGKSLEGTTIFNYSIVGAILGARIFYACVIDTDILLKKPGQILFPFDLSSGIKFLGTTQFSMIGGMIGVVLAMLIYSKVKKKSFFKSLDKALLFYVAVIAFVYIGTFFHSLNYGKPTNCPLGVLFTSKVERGLLKLPCCVMRIPDGKNPLDKVMVKKGKTLVHEADGFQPIIIYLFFSQGGTEQLVNEFLIGDVKNLFYGMRQNIYEPGTEPLHYTIYEETKDKYIARIQSIGIARHPIALYEGLVFILLFSLTFWFTVNSKSRVGFVSAILLIIGSVLHFALQFVSDFIIPVESLPFTMDQYFSIPLLILGIAFLFYSKKEQNNLG
jgi:phosphatidylglycerol---prolipoprotein diacylglyceryl transferase